jgi:hemolysin activation/secretion protein
LRGEYQWSNDLLVAMEQYSVGGPDNVRAFPPAQQLLDRALFLSAEIIHRMPFVGDKPGPEIFGNRTWGELVQISAFYDHAVGRLNDPLSSEPSGHINFKGAGLQLRLTSPGFIESRLMFAWEVGSDEATNERRPQIWGDLTYRF